MLRVESLPISPGDNSGTLRLRLEPEAWWRSTGVGEVARRVIEAITEKLADHIWERHGEELRRLVEADLMDRVGDQVVQEVARRAVDVWMDSMREGGRDGGAEQQVPGSRT